MVPKSYVSMTHPTVVRWNGTKRRNLVSSCHKPLVFRRSSCSIASRWPLNCHHFYGWALTSNRSVPKTIEFSSLKAWSFRGFPAALSIVLIIDYDPKWSQIYERIPNIAGTLAISYIYIYPLICYIKVISYMFIMMFMMFIMFIMMFMMFMIQTYSLI